MKGFQRLSIATTAAAVAAVTLGAYVRSSGSGLGCPDWPKCHGKWIPPMQTTALIEYSHRMAVTLLGILGLIVVLTVWLRFRTVKSVFRPAMLAVLVVFAQAWIGRLVVLHELPSNLVALHFFVALALIAILAVMTVNSFFPRGGGFDGTAKLTLAAASIVFAALMAGALVTQAGAALVFGDWPLMEGRLIPDLTGGRVAIHFTHRVLAVAAGAALIYAAIHMRNRRPEDRVVNRFSQIAVAAWILQVAAGGLTVLFRSAESTVVVHVLLASLLWVAVVALLTVCYRRTPESIAVAPGSHSVEPSSLARLVRAYIRLTKPRIIELLLITTVPVMIVAHEGLPPLWLILATLGGGTLAAGSANAINCYLERDIDEIMRRTSTRPLPLGEIEPPSALRFGVAIGGLGVAILAVTVNVLAAVLALGAILFYVLVYTVALKRTTPSNIVIGGAAGAAPVLIGWAAVTGRVDLPAIAAFLIVFYWTPPHFWALALRYSSEYRAARVPMLPVVAGESETGRRILIYCVALGAASLLFSPVARAGFIYLGAAALLGLAFLTYALRLRRAPGPRQAMSLFRFSIAYLTLLFVAMGIDTLIAVPQPQWLHGFVAAAAAAIFVPSQAVLAISSVRMRNQRRPLAHAS